MKILVTVGTTKFDSLTLEVSSLGIADVIIQHANHDLLKIIDNSAVYYEDINSKYDEADLIITHAGAGSVYSLLEKGKKLIVVPNFDRIDQHQFDLAKYVEINNFALVAWNVKDIKECVIKSYEFTPIKYQSNKFFKFDEITSLLNE